MLYNVVSDHFPNRHHSFLSLSQHLLNRRSAVIVMVQTIDFQRAAVAAKHVAAIEAEVKLFSAVRMPHASDLTNVHSPSSSHLSVSDVL